MLTGASAANAIRAVEIIRRSLTAFVVDLFIVFVLDLFSASSRAGGSFS
jgi:hypothetical protein|tara:strand:- start:68 stop:214 length:147 start_codon:yes stop_codon:yes gene_type:complete